MEEQEKNLLQRIKSDDALAFRLIYFKYSYKLWNWSYKITENKQASEDIVQDFFIQFWVKRRELVFYPSFLSYAYRSVYNASLNYLRDTHKFVYDYEVVLEGLSEEQAQSDDAEELQMLLHKAIEELPDRCKKIFTEVHLKKKQYAEVASTLGISVNTVKVQVSKAYKLIREKVGIFLFL